VGELDPRPAVDDVVDGHLERLEDHRLAALREGVDQIGDHLGLPVDEGIAAGIGVKVESMGVLGEAQVETVVPEGLPMEAVAHAEFVEDVDGSVLEDTGPDAAADVVSERFSRTRASTPCRASMWASERPAGPAPMITTEVLRVSPSDMRVGTINLLRFG